MGEINHNKETTGHKDKKPHQKNRPHIQCVTDGRSHVLLLTFFMLTTTFSKPKTMEVNIQLKTDNPDEQQKVTLFFTDYHNTTWQ